MRASLRHTNRKDWQKITPALREICTASTVSAAEARFEAFAAEFGDQYGLSGEPPWPEQPASVPIARRSSRCRRAG
ncbi:hypothetical protein [Micromonospora okii]|uniref:hypothetical protein n=1 Tax=Micromonospora okii TaxID=1182970 RepID=UPI001E585C5F|nr:hypothetical protein [Micromonospora okii]